MRKTLMCAALAFCAVAGATDKPAADDPLNDPMVQKTLRAMSDASTWYHPDLFGEFAGMRHFAHHDYKGALKYFEVGAYYADKLSQLSIGLMHLNGEGVAKDPVQAYAWLDLAAEREYPDFVATRDRVKAALSPEQLKKAQDLRSTLAQRYADNVAKPRMEQQLRFGMEQMTGSRTGFDFGVSHDSTKGLLCHGSSLDINGMAVPEAGCGSADIYAASRWQPDKYFALRDSQWKATVTVGDIQQDASKPSAPPANPGEPDKH
jgi:hypothetical protein